MAKRPTMKGKGADIFLEKPEDSDNNAPLIKAPKPKVKKTKATFYLPQNLIDDFEEIWFSLRRSIKGKKIDKSSIVTAALEEAIKEYREKQNNSFLSNHFTGKS